MRAKVFNNSLLSIVVVLLLFGVCVSVLGGIDTQTVGAEADQGFTQNGWSLFPRPKITNSAYSPGEVVSGVATLSANDIWVVGHYRTTPAPLTPEATTSRPTPSPTATTPLNPPAPLPGTGSVTFPETGMTLSGIFLTYWQRNGGLAQQGYPITNVMGEVSDLDGKLYTVQYFERAVFEYHPQEPEPYKVLLSHLGRFEYDKKYPGGAPSQRPNGDPGTLFFPQTGKRLGGSFLEYWRANGGLMQQGYPISDEFTERSELDGRLYTVQYFERAVFEYHPENKKPYDVLLSHLGRFRWEQRYGVTSPSSPSPTAMASPSPVPRLIKSLPSRSGQPLVVSDYLFWEDSTDQGYNLRGYNLRTNGELTISGRGCPKSFVSDGTYLVWSEGCSRHYTDAMRGYTLGTGRTFDIRTHIPREDAYFFPSAIVDGVLYYRYIAQEAPGRSGIYARNLTTGEEKKVFDRTDPINISPNGIVLWQEAKPPDTAVPMHTPTPGGPDLTPVPPRPDSGEHELYMLALDGRIGKTFLAAGRGMFRYSSWGDIVAWTVGDGVADTNIYVYNARTGSRTTIPAGYTISMQVKDNVLVWNEGEPGTTQRRVEGKAIKAYELSTGRTRTLVEDPTGTTFFEGIADGRLMIYSVRDWGTFERRIYGINF